ncbi:hypothetical protein VNO77_33632 [Canavalia gladiata]|uniref:C2 domain-containing protein n=1 Tax=Canavalia gladiata TaxID=3824 RepID=A0AAN9KC70_CANGL
MLVLIPALVTIAIIILNFIPVSNRVSQTVTTHNTKQTSQRKIKLQVTMASRYELEVKLTTARGLKNVNWRNGANRPYVVVWVDSSNKLSTKVDEDGDIDANWDQTLVVPLPPKPFDDLTLHIDVVHAGSEEGTKPIIGSARLRLVEVINDVGLGERASRTLTLKRPSGRPQGRVDVKVVIREPSYGAQGGYYAPPYGVPPPQTGLSRDLSGAPPAYGYQYGAPQQGAYYSAAPPAGYPSNAPSQTAPYGQGYPQQTPSYGQGYPQQTPSYGQGYPQQMASYGQGPEQMGSFGQGPQQTASYGQGSGSGHAPVEEKKKSKFGMGTGLAVGAVAGVLGGIALVEGAEYIGDKITDHMAEKVEEKVADDRERQLKEQLEEDLLEEQTEEKLEEDLEAELAYDDDF